MSTITIDPSDDVIIVIPGLCEIFATGAGFTVKPADGVQGEQLSDMIVFSRQKGPVLPLLSEKLGESALLAYMNGRPAVEQLRNRLGLLLINHPEARVANSIRPHADVIPFRWDDRGAPQFPETTRKVPEETVGYVFYSRDGQAMHASFWNDGTVGAGAPFEWPAEAGSL